MKTESEIKERLEALEISVRNRKNVRRDYPQGYREALSWALGILTQDPQKNTA